MAATTNNIPKPFWPWLKTPTLESIREIQLLRLEQQSENDKRQLRRTKIKKEPKKDWIFYHSEPGNYSESPCFRTRKEAKEELIRLGYDLKVWKVRKIYPNEEITKTI